MVVSACLLSLIHQGASLSYYDARGPSEREFEAPLAHLVEFSPCHSAHGEDSLLLDHHAVLLQSLR